MSPLHAYEPIHLIGIGCGGSRIARCLAQGSVWIDQLHAWDADVVECSNIRSQTYEAKHVGLCKVDALAQQMETWGGPKLIGHAEHVEGPRGLAGTIFVGVDTMKARWDIWQHSIKKKKSVSLMIEMRLETTGALIHVVNPNDDEHIRQWERYWYPDPDETVSCGTAASLGPIADLVASVAVWQLVRFLQIEEGGADRLDNQIRISMIPVRVEAYQW